MPDRHLPELHRSAAVGQWRGLRATTLMLAACASIGLACPADAAQVLARFANGQITSDDVDAVIIRQHAGNTPQARQAVLRTLVAAYAVEEELTSKGKELPPVLEQALADPRRQMMLDYYLQNQFTKHEPTDADIDAFVASNPQFFANRATFRYFDFMIETRGSDATATVQAAIGRLRATRKPTIEAVNRFKADLREQNIRLIAEQHYQGSEQLPSDQLRLFEELATSRTWYRVEPRNGSVRLVALLDRIADPVDPVDMRPQIVRGLIAQDMQSQRRGLVDAIGAAKLEDLRRHKDDDSSVLDLSGRPNPMVRKIDVTDEGGFFLRLFRRVTADTTVGIMNKQLKEATIRARYSAINLGLIALLVPIVALGGLYFARASLARRSSRRRSWERRPGLIVPMVVTVTGAVGAGLATKLPGLLDAMGGRAFTTVGVGAGLVGAGLAYAINRRAEVSGGAMPLGGWLALALALGSVIKFG